MVNMDVVIVMLLERLLQVTIGIGTGHQILVVLNTHIKQCLKMLKKTSSTGDAVSDQLYI